ncbi:MAG TPA: alpha-2-macroglobulin family protein, partial [Candidatus Baltobacteraceae bacterium]
MSGESVKANWESSYLFGAPVQGGDSHIYVTRSRAYVTPAGWDTYAFGRDWYYPEQEPSVSSDVLEQDSTVPADGASAQTIAVANDLPYPMTYEVDAQTTDVSNLSVADSKTFTAYPRNELIGLQTDFVAGAQQAHAVNVIVIDPDGKPLSGHAVHLVLQRRSYSNATQIVAGSQTPVDAVHYVDAGTADVTSASTPQTVSFTPPQPGDYRIRANFSDAGGDASATDSELWVSGPGDFAWGPNQSNALTIKLDKTTYAPGQVARVLVQSPYPKAELYLAVVRHGVLLRRTQLVEGAAPQVQFIVTPEMLPNAALEVVLVRRGAPLGKIAPASLTSLARTGLTPFEVSLDAKYLKVTLTPAHAQVEPQQMQRVRVHVTDRAGHGVPTELALAVVNEAILQLSGYRFPDLAKIVYADQPISTRFADSRDNVTLSSPTLQEKGYGYGGGLEPGAAGTRVRTQFQPIAFYDGKIRTDDQGNATVSFSVPDNLTTWRVMAMAFSADARFATADTTFIASKALVTDAVLPQFARPGDVLRGGVAVTNAQHIT